MQYVRLGRTGLRVSRLCLGTMNFGPETSEKDAFRIMDRAVEHGINFFDTADVYGGRGKSEEFLGKALGSRRNEVLIATKFGSPMSDDGQSQGVSRSTWCIW